MLKVSKVLLNHKLEREGKIPKFIKILFFSFLYLIQSLSKYLVLLICMLNTILFFRFSIHLAYFWYNRLFFGLLRHKLLTISLKLIITLVQSNLVNELITRITETTK